jgi:UDP-N-acetylglucosamine:LPS N-acetylglucosamine transferase
VACTAGFESVCEAVYLGKPLLMVPVENHLEQYLNGCDAEQAGIAVRDTAFRLSRLLDPVDAAAVSRFRLWVDEAEARAMRAVEQTAFQGRSRGSAPADEAARPDGIGKPEGAGHSTP